MLRERSCKEAVVLNGLCACAAAAGRRRSDPAGKQRLWGAARVWAAARVVAPGHICWQPCCWLTVILLLASKVLRTYRSTRQDLPTPCMPAGDRAAQVGTDRRQGSAASTAASQLLTRTPCVCMQRVGAAACAQPPRPPMASCIISSSCCDHTHRVAEQHQFDARGWPCRCCCYRALLALLLVLRWLVDNAGVCLARSRCGKEGTRHQARTDSWGERQHKPNKGC